MMIQLTESITASRAYLNISPISLQPRSPLHYLLSKPRNRRRLRSEKSRPGREVSRCVSIRRGTTADAWIQALKKVNTASMSKLTSFFKPKDGVRKKGLIAAGEVG